jgi:3-oxoadipate enol-lactonase
MATLHVAGSDLYYEEHGEGEALVLLHGFGSSTRDWELQTPAFCDHFRVITLDFRGFGQSGRDEGPFSVERFAADTLAILDHLGVERFKLVGYSMGGAAAFQIATDVPERVEQLVLVNTQPSFRADTLRKKFEVVLRKAVVRFMGMERMARVIAGRLFPREDQQELRDRVMTRYSTNSPHVYLGVLSSLPGWSVVERLGRISAPTLVIAAEHDYTPVAEKEAYVPLIPDARLEVFENSRHGTPFDQTERFNQSVLAFFGVDGP